MVAVPLRAWTAFNGKPLSTSPDTGRSMAASMKKSAAMPVFCNSTSIRPSLFSGYVVWSVFSATMLIGTAYVSMSKVKP